jgi:CHAT domain-containing protein
LFQQGLAEFQQGQFQAAIRHWETTLTNSALALEERLNTLLWLANAYQTLGLSKLALKQLELAESLTLPKTVKISTTFLVKLYLSLSDVYLALRQDELARQYAEKSAVLSPTNPLLQAAILNNEGNVLTVEAYYAKAIQVYTAAVALAQKAGDNILTTRALINLAYAYLNNQQATEAVAALQQAWQQMQRLHFGYQQTFGLISLSTQAQYLQQQLFLNSQQPNATLREIAYQTLQLAIPRAEKLNNYRLLSYANGYLGQLYESERRYDEAISLTRKAIFYANQDQTSFFSQQGQGSEILYRWQWQLGRLFNAQGQMENAITAYQQAVAHLQPVRHELAIGYRKTFESFRDRLGPLYLELTDLLLQRATQVNDKERWLKQAVNTIELMKLFELQDYFQDECVADRSTHTTSLLANVQKQTAIIYPIVLSNRLELLLILPNARLTSVAISITANSLKNEVNEFRFELETGSPDWLPYAQQLYRWLIQPLTTALQEQAVETLIIVPDGVLRTIPFAALHDGKNFLNDHYALAVMPGLTLTLSSDWQQKSETILLAGLSQSVQNYSALAAVTEEIQAIRSFYQPNQVNLLMNKDFTVNKVASILKTNLPAIIHIASHGQFDSDPQKTFLLTYDDKLTMNQLEELIGLSERRQEPVELLTLSACQTAVGDDQAALGLGGLALKAGARSALATLWLVDDKATALLISEFYRQWRYPKRSKAKALQLAQQQVQQLAPYQHPTFWAPFLLIGNWQ